MDSTELELIIHGGRDLKNVKHLGTMNPYATVWIIGCGMESVNMTTPVHHSGGCYPKWEYSMKFHIVPANREYSIFIQIKHDGKVSDRDIGIVVVPLSELRRLNASEGKAFYPLTIPSGGKKGEIIVTHKFSQSFVSSNVGAGIRHLTDPHGKKKRDRVKRYAKRSAKYAATFGPVLLKLSGIDFSNIAEFLLHNA